MARIRDEYHCRCHSCDHEVAIACHLVARTDDSERAQCPRCGAELTIAWRPAEDAA